MNGIYRLYTSNIYFEAKPSGGIISAIQTISNEEYLSTMIMNIVVQNIPSEIKVPGYVFIRSDMIQKYTSTILKNLYFVSTFSVLAQGSSENPPVKGKVAPPHKYSIIRTVIYQYG